MPDDGTSLTLLIDDARQGVPGASDRLFGAAYDDLRAIAASMMRQERPGQTLQPTALVHEAFVRLTAGSGQLSVENRRHLFGVFANAMRQVLIDIARRKGSKKHGGGLRREGVEFAEDHPQAAVEPEDLAEVSRVLDRLEEEDPRAAEVVRMKVFAGLKMEQIAELMETPKRTVEREWEYARMWMGRELRGDDGRQQAS